MTEEKNILEEGKVIKAMEKLRKEKVEVDINPKKFLLQFSKEELEKLEKTSIDGLGEDDLKSLEKAKSEFKKDIENYSSATLKAIMVPLKYRDLQTIKNGIYEAVNESQKYNWDDNVKIRAMIREERTLTVFLSLKKKDDLSKQYYESLEDICKESDLTIDELYNIYLENFVLSDKERKNS